MLASDKITVGDKNFSLNALIIKHATYLPIMKSLFTENAFAQKANEDFETYLKRLFTVLYKREHNTPRAKLTKEERAKRKAERSAIADKRAKILSILGVDVIKNNPASSTILFKNTGNSYKIKVDAIEEIEKAINNAFTYNKENTYNFSFGVELEFVGNPNKVAAFNDAMDALVGEENYSTPMRYIHNSGKKWLLGTDGSVGPRSGDNNRFKGYELTSPILHFDKPEELEQLKKVTELVKDVFEGFTNKSCGTHIHMSISEEIFVDSNLAKFLARSYRKNESSLFDKLVPVHRRENRARFCLACSEYSAWERYRKLHICSDNGSNKLHVEFRQLNGTLNYDSIIAWAKLQKMFIELSLDTYKKAKDNTCDDSNVANVSVKKLDLCNLITSKEFDSNTIESFMVMSKMIA